MGAYNNDPDYTKTPYELDSIPGNTIAIGVTTNPFCAPPLELYVESLNQDVAVYNSTEGNGQYIAITAKKAGTATFKIRAQATSANTDTIEYTETTKDITITINPALPKYNEAGVKIDEQGNPAEYHLSRIKMWYDRSPGASDTAKEAMALEYKQTLTDFFGYNENSINQWLGRYAHVSWNTVWHNHIIQKALAGQPY